MIPGHQLVRRRPRRATPKRGRQIGLQPESALPYGIRLQQARRDGTCRKPLFCRHHVAAPTRSARSYTSRAIQFATSNSAASRSAAPSNCNPAAGPRHAAAARSAPAAEQRGRHVHRGVAGRAETDGSSTTCAQRHESVVAARNLGIGVAGDGAFAISSPYCFCVVASATLSRSRSALAKLCSRRDRRRC